MVHVPGVAKKIVAPETVQTAVVPDENVSGSKDEAEAPVMVSGGEFSGCPVIAPNVMDCVRLATTRLKFCEPLGRLPLDAVMVSG